MEHKKFAIIGNPLSHSLSPSLHNYWFKKYNINASYKLLEINKQDIKNIVQKIREKELSGINVTLPFKKEIIPYIDKVINDAEKSKSVNTVYLNSDNQIVGDNTDVYGLKAGYFKEIINTSQSKKKALVIGAGGVSPSIILALNVSKISNIYLTNRTSEKAMFLKKQFPFINLILK